MKGLGKTNEVIQLLRHLPYIESKPFSRRPEGLPGAFFIDWTRVARDLQDAEAWPDNELLMSEGFEDRFEGKIPPHCIGLVHGGYMMDNEEPDVILLDTKSGVIYWMDCPRSVRESASPKSSYLIYEIEEREQVDDEEEEENEGDKNGKEEKDSEEEGEDDSDEDEDEIRWGPCWPIRHFFEMLKNQYRQMNFMAKDEVNVFDIWTRAADVVGDIIPDRFTNHVQAIYRKHGWPDLSKYQKGECMVELRQVLEEEYPEHHRYYFRNGC
ncbi:hypothetical protein yc1106_06784 [Curvularia clavata]|uniref:Uncharacterized protein n=1 Tax=Curvularia clavata TaxID=95742 RepID=A0A9Q9DUZ5_CURCL|nr:hypothetical protein yc1106_06784 [Curvularia clavata]